MVLLREAQRTAPRQAVPATLMVVAAALVGADLLREDRLRRRDADGHRLANQRRIDVSLMLEFQGTLVQLLIGILFVLIAASVSPSEVKAVLPEALVLVVVMVLVDPPARRRAGDLALRSEPGERGSCLDGPPRIVAGATASAFGLELEANVAGAELILPIVFVAIFATVVLYGLTRRRWRGCSAWPGRRVVVLVVGGIPWARRSPRAQGAGLGVRLWIGPSRRPGGRARGRLQAERGRMMLDAVSREAELEDVTDALLLTGNDDFNALAAAGAAHELGHGRVYRAAPDIDETDLLAPARRAGDPRRRPATSAELGRRFEAGARLVEEPVNGGASDGDVALFVVTADGDLRVASADKPPLVKAGDRVIALVGAG